VSPSADKVQCPFCLGHPRLKNDGTMYDHDWGRPGMRKRCPGAGRTKDGAKAERDAAKSEGRRPAVLSGRPDKVDAPSETRPEDIF
jgi:hypothetical protein